MASKYLSSDMIFEVLTRIKSLETLDTCKKVLDEWDRLTHESSFMPNYCERTNNVCGYFLQDLAKHNYVSQFVSIDQAKGAWQWSNNTRIDNLPQDAKILASCDRGILCCVKDYFKGRARHERYYACRPASKQWQKLPNPKARFKTSAIAITVMQSNEDYLRYKIVRLSRRHNLRYMKGTSAYTVEIFDSGVWSWSVKEDLILPFGEHISLCPAVEISSSLYWLTTDNNVLVFRPHSNSFNKFSLPEQVLPNDPYGYKKLLEYQGKLGFASVTYERDTDTNLWVMDDPKHNLWVKKIAFNTVKVTGERVQHPFVKGFYNAEIVFMTAYAAVVFHKLQDGSNGIMRLDKMIFPQDIFAFRSDVEPVNLRPKVGEVSKVQKSGKSFRKTNRRMMILLLASTGITLGLLARHCFSFIPC